MQFQLRAVRRAQEAGAPELRGGQKLSPDESMCEECGKRPATWHLTDFVDGQPEQHNLCERCYRKKHGTSVLGSHLALAQLLTALAPELTDMANRRCPVCGISYLEFRQTMRLGCPNDYEVFETALEQLLERIHGTARHCGKVPSQAGKAARIHSRLRLLRRRQKKAVAVQDYELAAQLRDRISQLQENADELDRADG